MTGLPNLVGLARLAEQPEQSAVFGESLGKLQYNPARAADLNSTFNLQISRFANIGEVLSRKTIFVNGHFY